MSVYESRFIKLSKTKTVVEEKKPTIRVAPKLPDPPPTNIYEKAFIKSDKTDAILVVDGKKLHVNKALLSYHSDYFNALFNSNFIEKSLEEVEIKDVNLEDFATILSLVHDNHIIPKRENLQNLLKLADRFLLPGARRHLNIFYSNQIYFQ